MTSKGRNVPRYVELARKVQSHIEKGEYSVGSQLPTEAELCEAFSVSRHTVREALRRLAEAGLVQRRQGSGSQVVALNAKSGFLQSMRSLNELYQYASDTHLRIDSVRQAVPEVQWTKLLDGKPGRRWLIVEGLRQDAAGLNPICWSKVFINRSFASIGPSLKSHRGAIHKLIEERFGKPVEAVEQAISARPMTANAAKVLGVSSKLWAVRVIRRYLDRDGQLLIVSVNDHPGDTFSYAMTLRRGWR